jgi:hypothetical membrane protein
MSGGRNSWPLWGAVAGIVGSVEFAIMWTLAALTDGHWVIGVMTLSELGGDRPGRWFFNIGVIVTGVLFVVFIRGLLRTLPRGLLTRIGTSLSFLGCIALIAIGVFPITTGTPHTVASWAFFSLMILGLAFMVRPIRYTPSLGTGHAILTAGVVALAIVLLVMTSVPLAEAATVIGLMVWGFAISATILLARLVRRTPR